MAPTPRARLSLGTPQLNKMVGGGLLEGTAVLLSGAPGIGKTTMGLQFLIAGIEAGEPGLLISFEEFPASLIRDAKQLGWDLRAMEKQGLLHIMFTSPQVFLSSLRTEGSPLSQLLRTHEPRRVVIDSMAHFQQISSDPLALRETYNTLVNAMKREQLTALLLDEAINVLAVQRGRMASLPFVVDAVILMRYVEVDSTVQRAITVMKMRGSAHDKSIRRFEIKEGGLQLGEPFTNREGILAGTPYRTG